jgi:glycosyltransferase involved in cell wall biosynthesis
LGLNLPEFNLKADYLNRFKSTRVLFVVNTLKAFGGAERQALILATYIKAHVSPNVAFLAFEDGGDFRRFLEEAGIEAHYFPFKHLAPKYKKAIQYYRLIRYIKPLKPEVLIPYVAESNKIVAQIWPYTGARFAFWNQREEGRKLYGTSHEKQLIQKVPAIVSNSYEGRDALVRVYGLSPEQIHVINNGIIPYQDDVALYDWYAHFGISKQRPLVSMIANITNRKDHETLLKAWHLVIKSCKEKELALPFLVLAGRKADTYDALRLLGFDLKLCEHMGFTGTLKTVQELIRQSLFCVFSSNLEGCPNGVLECMEQGKAVVGTHISGVEQALGAAYKGICLSQPNNAQDLANKIMTLYEQPELIKEIGKHNRQRIETEFSVEQMVKGYLHLIPEQFTQPK